MRTQQQFGWLVVLSAASMCVLHGQTTVDLRTQSKSIDFSTAAFTRSTKTGTPLPAVCQVGETFFLTSAPAGNNLYGCTSLNTWSLMSGAASGGAVSSVFGRTGAVVAVSGDYSFGLISGTAAITQGGTGATTAATARTNLGAAATAHTHVLTDLSGITGKQGSGTVIQAFGGGAATNGNCVKFDANGNVVDAGGPCGGSASFTAGVGVAIAGNVISTDDTVIPFYVTGSGAPTISCTAGRDYYVDTTSSSLYFCKAANTWQGVGDTVLDKTVFSLEEEFPSSSSTSSPSVGALGWVVRAVGSAGALSYVTGTWPSIGVLRVNTPATAAQGTGIALDQSSTALFSSVSAQAGWELRVRFKLSQTTNTRLRVGLFPAANTAAAPTEGIFLRYDVNAGDTGFLFECRTGGTPTTVASGVAADSNWHTVRIYSNTAGTIGFQLDGGTVQSIASGVPTGALTPAAFLVNDATATAGSVDYDFVKFRARGLSR